jgi:hypothetical protein
MARKRLDAETQRIDAAELARAAKLMDAHVRDQPTPAPTTIHPLVRNTPQPNSEVRIATGREDDPWLDRVPVVVATEDDLAWFGTDLTVQAILALIDGTSTVRAIVARAPMANYQTVGVLRDLESHRVVVIE